jgi:hypothetical protein
MDAIDISEEISKLKKLCEEMFFVKCSLYDKGITTGQSNLTLIISEIESMYTNLERKQNDNKNKSR